MNGEELWEKLGNIDAEFIMEAKDETPVVRRFRIPEFVGLAACIALLLLAGSALIFADFSAGTAGGVDPHMATSMGTSGGLLQVLLYVLCAGAVAGVIFFIIRIFRKRREEDKTNNG